MSEVVKSALSQYETGYSLPQKFYTSPEAFEFDMQHIFKKHWIHVGTVADVKKKGDYRVIQIDNNSIIIVRGQDDIVRAFYNSCRHRGAKVCVEDKGTAPKLVCPYHQWVYELDGSLIHSSRMGEGFNCDANGLKPIALENIGGLLFLNLSDEPDMAALEQMKSELEPYAAFYQLDKLKAAYEADLIEQANWKLVVENNRECYHCGANHPELLRVWPPYGVGFGWPDNPAEKQAVEDKLNALYDAKVPQWQAMGMPYDLVELDENRWYRAARMLLTSGAYTQTMDGQLAVSKLLPPFTEKENSSLSMWTHPNAWLHFTCDHVLSTSVFPLSENQTLVRTRWLVREDAEEGVDYDLDNLTHTWKQTNDQDRMLAEITHAGCLTDGYIPGPYSEDSESLLQHFTEWYVKQIKQAL